MKNPLEYAGHTESLAGGVMAFLVDGNCLEGEDIADGDYVLIDFTRMPDIGDVCLCEIRDENRKDILAVKQFAGMFGPFLCVGTRYKNAPFQKGYNATKIYGVAYACLTPDKELKWERDISDRADSFGERHRIKGGNISNVIEIERMEDVHK